MKGFKINLDNTEMILEVDSTFKLAKMLNKYGAKKILLLYGMGSIKRNGLYKKVSNILIENAIDFVSFGGIKANPILKTVNKAVEFAKKENVDFILAVGGGSVIDSAKAIAANFIEGGDVWDYYIGKRIARSALPIGVILTIPATGSESNPYSVLSNDIDKKSASSKAFLPKFSLLDPVNTYSLALNQTAYGLIDIFVHVAEQYFVNEDGGVLRDYFCESVFKTVIKIAKPLLNNPKSEELRMESFWAGNIALSRFLMKGIKSSGDWATHSIEHQFSAINDMPHGAGLAIVFPAWLEIVAQKEPEKVLKFSKNIFNVDSVQDGIIKLRSFFESLNVPTYLLNDSIKSDDIKKIVDNSVRNEYLGDYVKLSKSDIESIVKISLKL